MQFASIYISAWASALLDQQSGRCQSGTLNIRGVNDGTPIWVYEANGKLAGTGISRNGKAAVNTDLQTGAIAIVKIGERSVKVVIK